MSDDPHVDRDRRCAYGRRTVRTADHMPIYGPRRRDAKR
jgi:hypothetical protein